MTPKLQDQKDLQAPAPEHVPVMLDEVLQATLPLEGHICDATFGRGGYTKAFLDAAHKQSTDLKITAIDRDESAIAFGQQTFSEAIDKGLLTLHHARFSEIGSLFQPASLDAIVFDFGLSSPQVDTATRGFSFSKNGPLDMRMGLSTQTAADFLNTASEADIANVLREFGGEKYSRPLARKIVQVRPEKPFQTTQDLAALFQNAPPPRPGAIHPATRTFQALRIWVNNELDEIKTALSLAPKLLKPGGRLVTVSFHEGEDRLAKHAFKPPQKNVASRHQPYTLGYTKASSDLFDCPRPQPRFPSAPEIKRNPRARSARMRFGILKRPASGAAPNTESAPG